MEDKKLRRAVYGAALFVLAAAILWLVGRYIFNCLVPFIIAYIISLVIRPAAERASRKFGVRRRFISLFLVIALIALVFLFISWLASVLAREAERAASSVVKSLSGEENVILKAREILSDFTDKTSLGVSGDSLYDAAISVLTDFFTKIASVATTAATTLVSGLPAFLLALAATVISTFYMCTDKGALFKELCAYTGEERAARFYSFKEKIAKAFRSYLKSYSIIMLITFTELFAGFLIIGIENALLFALIIAIFDLLPVVGSGTVLIPWAAISLAAGNTRVGIGLLALEGVIYVVRQFSEPRIVGNMMGIHPLLSLVGAYVGFVLFGFAGVLLFPILLYLIKAVVTDQEEEKTSAVT